MKYQNQVEWLSASGYQCLPDGTAILDGYPIVWTDVLQAFSTSAAADAAIAVFGEMSFW